MKNHQFGSLLANTGRLLRPRQWVKNGFVFVPLLFAGAFFDAEAILSAVRAAVIFCLAASSVYVLNDIIDADSDRKHPKKQYIRPIASGAISIKAAITILITLYAVIALSLYLTPAIAPVVVFYILLNVAYAYWLKHQPIVDIFTIAFGFVLRVYAGALSIGVPLSAWMLITTLCLALYLAATKRQQELLSSGSTSRAVLKVYSPGIVQKYADISAICTLLFYSIFVVSERQELILTIPIVIFGFFRFYYIVDQFGEGESPTDALLSDWPLGMSVVVWIVLCGYQLSSIKITG